MKSKLLEDGTFLIENYNQWPHFSSFLPGIAGPNGIPMWVFYVNRGQLVASFGVRSKNEAILEFMPADRAYEEVTRRGFRTFINIENKIYEAFRPDNKSQQKMYIKPESVCITEENKKIGVSLSAIYYTLPGENFPALVREVTIKSYRNCKMKIADGLPFLIPAGTSNKALKEMSYTIKSWMRAKVLNNNIALYKLSCQPKDEPVFYPVEEANFFCPIIEKVNFKITVAPFEEKMPTEVITELQGEKPSAFVLFEKDFEPGESLTFYSVFGRIPKESFAKNLLKKFKKPHYFKNKKEENRRLIQEILNKAATVTRDRKFDFYVMQSFLDNILRGGLPPNYLYSRRHGDLERDYNNFLIPPVPASSGEGNFRDVFQNRRNDVFFSAGVKEKNIKKFYSLIQPDGFNPLVVAKDYEKFGDGFWIDHWTYGLDLIESYLRVYPDKKQKLFFETYVDFPPPWATVTPLFKRFKNGKVLPGVTEVKERGKTFSWPLFSKLLLVTLNKLCSIDRYGAGIEMEADKPGWNDSLNGLPGLYGSSTSELWELKRQIKLMLDVLAECPQDKLNAPVEVAEFLRKVSRLISDDYSYKVWKESHRAKYAYWQKVEKGFCGKSTKIGLKDLSLFLKKSLKMVSNLCEKTFNKNMTVKGYFYNCPATNRRKDFGLFLEPHVHVLRVEKNKELASKIYKAIKNSDLYDEKLKMYKLNENISKHPLEVGRVRAFPRGWLENESIWLHMEYKYLLEILNCGLYDEFFAELKNCFVCFLDPQVYGRSILENSSFIVSSAHVNGKLHGRGFYARLTGTTAEVLHIWLNMMLGTRGPFFVKNGQLVFKPSPILKGDMFLNKEITINLNGRRIKVPKNGLMFTLFGKTPIIYVNQKRVSTFGKNKVEPVEYKIKFKNRTKTIKSKELPEPFSIMLREAKLNELWIRLDHA